MSLLLAQTLILTSTLILTRGLDSEELKNGLEMFGMQIYDYEIIAIMARLDKEFEFEIQYQDFLEGVPL